MKTEQQTSLQTTETPNPNNALTLSRKQLIITGLSITLPLIGLSTFAFATHSKLRTTQQTLSTTETNLQTTTEEKQILTEENESLENTVSDKDAALEDKEKELTEKEEELADKEKELQEREAALSTSRNQLSSAQSQNALLDSNIRVLKNCLEGMAGVFVAIDEENPGLALSSIGRIEGTCEDAGDIVADLD